MKALPNLRSTGRLLVMASKTHPTVRFNPVPDECIEPDDRLIAQGELAQLRQLEAPSSFFMKAGLP